MRGVMVRNARGKDASLSGLMNIQFATRVTNEQAEKFKTYTAQLGTTPSDAMRILIAAFNQNKGFPCEIRLNSDAPEVTTSKSSEVSGR